MVFFFFFFSSRRRHTRLTCDWSSDVCSSDLERLGDVVIGAEVERLHLAGLVAAARQHHDRHLLVAAADHAQQRSEEHTSELQSHVNLVCRLLLEKKKKNIIIDK